jgi:hypothetical protein
MKSTWGIAVICAVFVGLAAYSSAEDAKITLKLSGGDCTAVVTPDVFNVKGNSRADWTVENTDCPAQKVTVGRTKEKAATSYLAVLRDCTVTTVKKGAVAKVGCHVNIGCAGPDADPKRYKYSVCLNGRDTDPDLRVGGGGSGFGPCGDDKEPAVNCEKKTK